MSRHPFPELIQKLPAFDGAFEAKRLEADGCEVLFASYPAGTQIAAHRHESANCGVITRGELLLTTGSQERRYGPGDWYQLAPGEEHGARFEVDTAEIEFWFAVTAK